ncbi:winged helix-turn-helix domain-containing protein [Brevibacillus massiliensis]|uniref:winged helix-turn-helix domain-containing protein n=1 Tax=Brevibacillus massiliensis TaxID=1118054 RepID=UPI0036F1BAF4
MTKKEFQLLVFLLRHAGMVLSRDQILDQVPDVSSGDLLLRPGSGGSASSSHTVTYALYSGFCFWTSASICRTTSTGESFFSRIDWDKVKTSMVTS